MADIRIKWEAPLNQAIVDSIAIYRYDGITTDCAEVSENGVLLIDTLASDSTVYDDLDTPELGLITYGVFSKNPSGLSQCALSSISLEPTISQSPTNLITIYLDASNSPSGLTQVNADFTVGPEALTSTLELNPKYGVDVGYYVYPFFLNQAEADYFDSQNGGTGSNHSMTYHSITYYMPDSGGTHNGSSAPSDIVINGNTFSYNKIDTGVEVAKLDESEEAPTGLTAVEEVIIVAPTSGPTELTSVEEAVVLAQGDILTNTLDTDVDLEMLYVEPGTFTMGSPTTETGRQANETEHNVSLTKGFYLGKYEVTQSQYEAVMAGNTDGLSATPSQWPNNPNRPVEKVSWDDAQIFLSRLNTQQSANIPAGWAYVLPTEAQWEYACRAGTATAYPWGPTIASLDANYSGSGLNQTSDAGNYPDNPWGFFDMHGNVREWTADWYGSYSSGAQTDPTGAASGSVRVLRGGSWTDSGANLRSAFRYSSLSDRYSNFGFRVALVPEPPQPLTSGPTELTAVEEILAPTSGPTELTSAEEAVALAQGDILTNTLDTDVDLEMLYVEPGSFTMGSPTTETGRVANETEHNVSLTQGFYLGKYEVTQAQYEAVMTGNTDSLSATPSNWPNNPNRPVERVSWDDAQIFLSRLNTQQSANIPSGWAYVLPTEAQWEYACRAGTTTEYFWGATIATSNANYTSSGLSQTRDVGYYAANPWGFFDMHGNVLEFTADWYGSYSSGAQTDPTGAASSTSRVIRGGSWSDAGTKLRSAYRLTHHPSNRYNTIGFRVALVQE